MSLFDQLSMRQKLELQKPGSAGLGTRRTLIRWGFLMKGADADYGGPVAEITMEGRWVLFQHEQEQITKDFRVGDEVIYMRSRFDMAGTPQMVRKRGIVRGVYEGGKVIDVWFGANQVYRHDSKPFTLVIAAMAAGLPAVRS